MLCKWKFTETSLWYMPDMMQVLFNKYMTERLHSIQMLSFMIFSHVCRETSLKALKA